MAAVGAVGSWFAILLVVLSVSSTGWVTVAILGKVLNAPGRTIIVGVRVLPWPRIDIRVSDGDIDDAP